MKKISQALISVSDKRNLKKILTVLKKFRIKIISSGGTFKEIKNMVLNVMRFQILQNFPKFLMEELKPCTQKFMLEF